MMSVIIQFIVAEFCRITVTLFSFGEKMKAIMYGAYDKQYVKNVSAIDGRDVDAEVNAIAECDIIATALGENIIKFVAPNIAKAIVKRYENGIAVALEKYCDITDAADVEMVGKFYEMLKNKASFAELCEVLSDYKYRD